MGERANEIRDNMGSSFKQDPNTSYLDDNVNNYSSGVLPEDDTTVSDSDASADDTVDVQTEAIREDIEQTREEMARTVDEIQARLTPQNIVEQVKESAKETANEAIENVKQTVHDATVGKVENMVSNVSDTAKETGSGLMGLIKDNPVPAALAGIGLGWLFMKRQNEGSQNKGGFGSATGYGTSYPYSYGSTQQPRAVAYQPSLNYSSTQSNNQGGSGLVDKIRQNPIPAAVAGASIGYLLMKSPSQSSSSSTGYTGYNYGSQNSQSGLSQVKDKVGDMAGQTGQKVGDIASGAGDVAGNVVSSVGDVAGNVVGSVGDVAGNVVGGVGDVAGNVVGGVGDVAGNVVGGVQQGAQNATNQLERMLQENPLVVGGVAVVLGAVIGMLLPATEKENQLLGKAHDTLMEKAGEAVQQTMDKVGGVAEEATNTIKEEAKNQGLTQ